MNDHLKKSNIFQQYIPNYKLNLIDVEHMDNLENLQTDLQIMFGMLQCRSNTEKLKQFVEQHKDYFSKVDRDTYLAMREFLHSESKLKKALKTVEVEDGKEQVNVCKAIDGIYDNGYNDAKKMMQALVDEAEEKAQKAEEKAQKAEADKQRTLENAVIKMLASMEVSEVAELLGLEVEYVKSLR